MAIRHPALLRVVRKRDRGITLLSDCLRPSHPAQLVNPQEGLMQRFIAVLLTVAAIGAATPVFAQDAAPGPGKVVITIIPGGATFFTEAEDNPNTGSFGNYDLGGAVAVNFNRYVGVEGEVNGAVGVSQGLQFNGLAADRKTPHILNYSG